MPQKNLVAMFKNAAKAAEKKRAEDKKKAAEVTARLKAQKDWGKEWRAKQDAKLREFTKKRKPSLAAAAKKKKGKK